MNVYAILVRPDVDLSCSQLLGLEGVTGYLCTRESNMRFVGRSPLKDFEAEDLLY